MCPTGVWWICSAEMEQSTALVGIRNAGFSAQSASIHYGSKSLLKSGIKRALRHTALILTQRISKRTPMIVHSLELKWVASAQPAS